LAIGEPVRAALPCGHDAETPPLFLAEGAQRGVHAGQMGRAPVREGEHDADQEGAHTELAGAHPDREQHLEARSHSGLIDDGL
jgi:hypothetical protein